MHIILDKPSLSFKKHAIQLPGKQIIVYTNQLERVSRLGIAKHLIRNNKLSSFDIKFSTNSMNNLQKQQFQYQIYFRTSPIKQNLVIDILLQKDQNFLSYKVQYPVILQFKTLKFDQTINSLTKTLSFKKDFQTLCKIGEGSFAQIFLARQIGTQYLRSIKIIDKERCMKLGQLSFIKNQFEVLKQIESNWHIQLYYAFQDEKNVYFVTQFCPFGDLYTQITQNFKQINLTTKYMHFIEICLEICRLHQKGYIYRDLKPQNVLIDFKGNAKLCDFGYAIKSKPDELRYQICGSYEYLPPQMVSKKGYNHSYDLYCLGLLFYEFLTGQNPFKGITSKNLQEITSRKINFENEQILPTAKDLLKKLLQKDPKKRIGYDSSMQIFKHQFFMENGQLIVKILKNQKIQSKQMQNIKIKNLGKKRQNIQYQFHNNSKINKIPFVFENKVYNYLAPQFDITQKMGPKMIPTDDKKMKYNNDSNI